MREEPRRGSALPRLLMLGAGVLLAAALVLALLGLRSGQLRVPWQDDAAPNPTALVSAPAGPSIAPDKVRVGGAAAAEDYEADALGEPVTGMDGVDTSGISPGGGQGPEGYDWTTMRPGELMIPQARLVVPVVERGLVQGADGERSMDLPVSFQAARLRESAEVGARRGTTVVAGHVNWADGSWAPMSNLYAVRPGMLVHLTDRDGTRTSWRVTGTTEVPQTELSRQVPLTDTTGTRRLELITCTAERDADGSVRFTKNLVVTAEPV